MSQDGMVLVSPDRKGEGLTVQEPLTGRTVAQLPEARYSVIPPEFSPNGKLIALPNEDQSVVLWDVVTGKQHGPRLVNRQPIQRVLFAPDGKVLVTVSPGGTLRLWDVATGQQLGPPWDSSGGSTPEQLEPGLPLQAGFSPDGRYLATLAADMQLRLWPAPKAGFQFREMELRTWTSLGIRTDAQGGWQAIPGPEWQALRREILALEELRGP
jgi:WD40 repeat protein